MIFQANLWTEKFPKKYPQIDAGGESVAVAYHSPRVGDGIGLPPSLKLRTDKVRDNQKVVVKKRGQGILVEDWKDFSENQS